MVDADRLRLVYESAMGVPHPAPWEKLAPSWQDVWRTVAREASVGEMTRRDHFAAAALIVMGLECVYKNAGAETIKCLPHAAAQLADSMLVELAKGAS